MSMVQHIISEIEDITQQEINIIHKEIHKIISHNKEVIDREEKMK